VLVLSWNLFHGRAVPEIRHGLLREFADRLAGWDWDVALLQEVPPWWPGPLARAASAEERHVLTSRNWLLALRRAVAERRPDVIKSNGGGCDAILVRGARIEEHRIQRLRSLPERRMAHAVRLAGGPWVMNLHGQAHRDAWAAADLRRAAAALEAWSAEAPAILGGDVNLRDPVLPGYVHAAGHSVDHVFARGLDPLAPGESLPHEPLSDHAPIRVRLAPAREGFESESVIGDDRPESEEDRP
jgi:endonuclease/exonuclease/phosphatase (EEP) superfamily protein YafD